MSNYTQVLTLGAALSAAGATDVVLSLKFIPTSTAPGATAGSYTFPTTAAAAGTNPIGNTIFQDNTGASVITTPITQDNMDSDDILMNYTLSVNKGSLESIAAVGAGTVTTYTVGTSKFVVGPAPAAPVAGSIYFNDAPSALNAAMDALLASTVDLAGGRAAIQFVGVDGRSVSYSTLNNTVSLPAATTIINNNVAEYTDNSHPGPGNSTQELLISTAPQITGFLRLMSFVNGDPVISSSGNVNVFAWKGSIALGANLGNANPGYMPSGFIALNTPQGNDSLLPSSDNVLALTGLILNAPSKVAASSAAPQYSSFPFDAATINAYAAAGGALNIYLNTAPPTSMLASQKLASNYLSINLAQADALLNNSAMVYALSVNSTVTTASGSISSLAQSSVLSQIAFGDVFKIRDSAANIQSLTIEAATSLANIQDVFQAEHPQGHFAPSVIEIIPTNASGAIDTTPITLDFAVAQTLANSGFAITQLAKVNVNIVQGFGTVTAADLLDMVKAGVDKIAFDNTTIPADPGKAAVGTPGAAGYVAAVPATPERDPFAGQNVRQVIIDQQVLNDVAKASITGLTVMSGGKLVQNKTIDVVVNVDDNAGGINIPSTLLNKLGVDRIVASDGNLDLSLLDTRNLAKANVFLGSVGDTSDVTLTIDHLRDLSSLKAQPVQKLAAMGVDVVRLDLSTDINGGPGGASMLGSPPVELDMYRSIAVSKNLLDTLSAVKTAGMAVDTLDLKVGVSLSSVMAPGAGMSFVNAVNLIGNVNVGTVVEDPRSHDLTENVVTVSTSGIRDNWVEISDMARIDSGIMGVASVAKSIAKANSSNGGTVLLKAGGVNPAHYSADDGDHAGLYDVLYTSANGSSSNFVSNMQTFGNLTKGIKNIYVDFRVDPSGAESAYINSSAADAEEYYVYQDVLLKNFSKLGVRGIVVDDSVINDYHALSVEITKDSMLTDVGISINADEQNLPISEMNQTLDIIYSLNADDAESSVGLSQFVYDGGSIVFNDGGNCFYKDTIDSQFRGNVNSIDKIVINNASNGDLSIDLSEFGLYGAGSGLDGLGNFATKVTHYDRDGNDTFHLAANNGKDVIIQIVGLTDWKLFTASDIKEYVNNG